MAAKMEEILKIVARARRVGWEVEQGNGRQDWVYRIKCPDKYRVQIHGTPSRNWFKNVMNDLNSHGFAEAEAAYELAEENARQEKLEEDRKRNAEALKVAEQRAKRAVFTRNVAGPYVAQVMEDDWFFKAHTVPETRRVLISPELAKRILEELNTDNRPIRKRRVAFWADLIRRGDWLYTHQGMAINTKPALQDGQHRLMAAVEEKFTLDVNMSVGMPSENFGSIDTGAARTAGDSLAVIGKTNTNVLAGSVRLVALYDIFGPELRLGAKTKVPNADIVEATKRYGEAIEEAVREATAILSRKYSTRKMSRSALAAGIFLIERKIKHNDPRMVEFMRGFRDGTDLADGDVRVALRSFMQNLGTTTSRYRRVPSEEQLGVFVKAWNAWCTNRPLRHLAFRGNELFPSVFVPPPLDDVE